MVGAVEAALSDQREVVAVSHEVFLIVIVATEGSTSEAEEEDVVTMKLAIGAVNSIGLVSEDTLMEAVIEGAVNAVLDNRDLTAMMLLLKAKNHLSIIKTTCSLPLLINRMSIGLLLHPWQTE